MLLDEPLAALDRKLRKEMQIELQDLQRQLGITFVLVTHDQEEALSLSDRICVMRAGRIVQIGSPQGLYDHPEHRATWRISSARRISSTAASKASATAVRRLVTEAGHVGWTAGQARTWRAGEHGLPQHPARTDPDDARGRRRQACEVTVHNRIFLGEHTEYLVRHDTLGNIIVLAPRQAEHGARGFETGERAHISWSSDAALILKPD